jgi:hypothetical protein
MTPSPQSDGVRITHYYQEGELYRVDAEGVPIWGQTRPPMPKWMFKALLKALFRPTNPDSVELPPTYHA